MSEASPARGAEAGGARRLRLGLVVEVLAAVTMVTMMVHVTLNALMRTFWTSSIPNTLEITQYWYMPTIAFLGFIAAQSRGQHVSADLIYEHLPEVTKRYVLAGGLVVIAVVSAYFAWFGWGEAVHAYSIRKVAGVSNLPAWPTYFLVPVGFGVLAVQFLRSAVTSVIHGDQSPTVAETDDPVGREIIEQGADKR